MQEDQIVVVKFCECLFGTNPEDASFYCQCDHPHLSCTSGLWSLSFGKYRLAMKNAIYNF
jgi:hypothetical protein